MNKRFVIIKAAEGGEDAKDLVALQHTIYTKRAIRGGL